MRIIGFAALTFAVISSLMASSASAWDQAGHRVIAEIAFKHLTPAARDRALFLLAADRDTTTAHDFASAATWADRVQDRNKHPWHFADIEAVRPNIPEACFGYPPLPPGTPASKGPERACVIDKVNQFADELADPNVSPEEQILALKFLLNLVGDLHQPLRVADEHDSHGMMTQVAGKDTTPGGLFTYWDKALVIALGVDPKMVAEKLNAQISEYDRAQWSSGGPHLWALEAHQLGVDRAYGMVGNLDANGISLVSDTDAKKALEVVSTQLSRAGIRLAFLLNDTLAPTAPGKIPPTVGSVTDGRQIALTRCSVCHMVASDQSPSRELTTAPDFQAIAKTRGMTQVAMRTFLSSPHPTMPTLRMSPKQANDVTAFILSLKSNSQ